MLRSDWCWTRSSSSTGPCGVSHPTPFRDGSIVTSLSTRSIKAFCPRAVVRAVHHQRRRYLRHDDDQVKITSSKTLPWPVALRTTPAWVHVALGVTTTNQVCGPVAGAGVGARCSNPWASVMEITATGGLVAFASTAAAESQKRFRRLDHFFPTREFAITRHKQP
jgi:hypothetical protein